MKMHSTSSWHLLGLGIGLLATPLLAEPVTGSEDRLPNATPQEMSLEGEVKGQRSQPKVLFILPWEDQIQTETIKLDDSLISEEDFLAPIDRVVFQEQINMYKQLENNP